MLQKVELVFKLVFSPCREMQEQIAALKARLQGKGPLPPGFKGAGGGGGAPGQDTITEEKIIEQVEVVETGISEEDMKRLEEELKQGTDMLEGKTKEEIKKIVEEKAKLEAEAKKKAAILKKQQEEMQKYQDSMAKLVPSWLPLEFETPLTIFTVYRRKNLPRRRTRFRADRRALKKPKGSKNWLVR